MVLEDTAVGQEPAWGNISQLIFVTTCMISIKLEAKNPLYPPEF
jgi:hypothetical protein